MATTNQPTNAENWLEEPKLPSGINVLTILTFIGSGLGLIGSVIGYFTAPANYQRAVDTQDKMDQVPSFFKGMMGPHPVETAKLALDNRLPLMLLNVVGTVLCLYAAMQMRKRKKTGFSLYIIGDVIPFIGIALFMNSDSFTGVGFYIGVLITILFIILYAAQLKHMK